MNPKSSFRSRAREILQKSAKGDNYSKNKVFEKNILSLIKLLRVKNILLFLPLKTEPNVSGAIKRVRVFKKRVYVPFIEDINFKIVKYRLPVKTGAYEILTCNNSYEYIKKIDLAIVPVVGIDSRFRRVGFGKGMYDRFFASYKQKPIVVFVQRVPIVSKKEIGESHDLIGDFLLSQNKIFVKGKKDNAYNSINSHFGRSRIRTDRFFCGKKNRLCKISNLRRAIKV